MNDKCDKCRSACNLKILIAVKKLYKKIMACHSIDFYFITDTLSGNRFVFDKPVIRKARNLSRSSHFDISVFHHFHIFTLLNFYTK